MNQCLLCEGEVKQTTALNRTFSLDGKIYQCKECQSCQLDPLPDKHLLDEYYQKEWSNDPLQMRGLKKSIFKYISSLHMATKNYFRWPFVKPYLKKESKILEMGAGDGAFLSFLKRKGFQYLYALEPSEQFQKELRKKGISLEDNMAGPSYDVCFAFHVLEHMRDPADSLNHVKQWIKPQGILMGEVPNVPFSPDSLSAFEKETVFNNVHLFHYSREGLKKLFQKAGFKDIECIEIGFGEDGIRRMFPKANCHLIHPSFKVPLSIKTQSFLHALESFFMPESQIISKKELRGYREPNDFIFFKAVV